MSSVTLAHNRLCVDFAALKYACPNGVYVAPVHDHPLTWEGVLFPRKGPYVNATLRFRIDFTADYPQRPPVITFLSEVFHPLVTPATTYTHSVRDTGTDTISAADEERLPPGGVVLRHAFPEWFFSKTPVTSGPGASRGRSGVQPLDATFRTDREQEQTERLPHIVEVLQYLRVAFDTEAVIDAIPLDVAANSGAWHAWRSFRTKTLPRTSPPANTDHASEGGVTSKRSTSPRQQPGGARRPGDWNWAGVWEDRVRKSVQLDEETLKHAMQELHCAVPA
ncbi:hypothetical protein BAUCODRAFT_118239 [Baudoinia panamericana UAMH 10762]|uniref:UBC core domain-containing protein n=1 Tax=Baudoinia panamericana (strain UAMH 10762) TaxID=717646 RepID=M2MU70_BAUPA|nr:uncharacterized protein BAUCODRAFT_118239 [Baudoinia panamericana UAMH 10762]EMD00472.1 hypothetical protein BAUCODRAFT_118239 [Baudoinia panamericana UAMH 10762]